jgi:UDP-GlcNAc:undecaprenyl-phosphate GlcNAc-1-phosphate transferase
MNLILVFGIVLINFLVSLVYFYLADKYQIIDKPNQRSSHSVVTIRGGGIVFVFGALMFSLLNGFAYPFLMLALVITGIVSFLDDVQGVSRRIRFLSHLLAIVLVLKECDLIQINWWVIPLFILLIGIVNAYNFMDGINGLTGFYSLAIFIPFWILEQDYLLKEFMLISILSLMVFLFFNARNKARCFAGDIGSISMALMVLFIVLIKIEETGRIELISVLFVYGIDSILTIVQRLLNNENIFDAHRKHLYQYLANEFKISHLWVSSAYGLVQLFFNFWLLFVGPSRMQVGIVVIAFGLVYIVYKRYLLNKFTIIKV